MISTILLFIFFYIISYLAINYYKYKKLKELELQFILASLQFYQLKFHMDEILKAIYEKASEVDPKYIQDYNLITFTLDKKVNDLGDWWIKKLEKTVGYKLNYNNWRELINKAEPFMKVINSYDSRKRD